MSSQMNLPFMDEDSGKLYLKLLSVKLKGRLMPGYYSVDGKRYRITVCLDKLSKWYGHSFLKTGSDHHDGHLLVILKPDGTPRAGNKSDNTEKGIRVLSAIMADPIQAMADYASITGICGVCGRKLEDPTSVALGIGPVCLGKLEAL